MLAFSFILRALIVLLLAIACSDENSIAPRPSRNRVVHVPAEAPTLQSAINSAAAGDTVLVAPGVYSSDGNRDIVLGDKRLILLSSGGPEQTIIDCQGSSSEPHFGFQAAYHPDGTKIVGFTIRNGYSGQGAAIDCHVSNLTITNCVFVGNVATVSGGAVRCKASSPLFVNCTFVGNSAPTGGGVYLVANSAPEFRQCIIAGSEGSAVGMGGASDTPTLICSNIFGNSGGDWVSYIAAQAAMHSNQAVDPQFCEVTDYHLQDASPCAPANSGCNLLIGALDVGCQTTNALSALPDESAENPSSR